MDARSQFYNDLVAAGAMPASPMPRPTQAERDAYNGGRLTVNPSAVLQDSNPILSAAKRRAAPLSLPEMPDSRIGMGEALIRIGGAGLGGALDGGNYLTPMADQYGAIQDYNRSAGLTAYNAQVEAAQKAAQLEQEAAESEALAAYRDSYIKTLQRKNDIAATKAEGKNNKTQDAGALMGSIVVNDAINRALPMINGFTTGVGGMLLSQLPATDATDMKRLIETMKANAGFDKLQAMRDASPTGGALGQVSEKELGFLQSVFGNLDQDQSTTQLKYNMQLFQFVYNSMIHGINEHPYAPPPGSEQTVNELKALLGYQGSINSPQTANNSSLSEADAIVGFSQ